MYIYIYIHIFIHILPGGPSRPLNISNGYSLLEKTLILVGMYNHQFQGGYVLMVGLTSRVYTYAWNPNDLYF